MNKIDIRVRRLPTSIGELKEGTLVAIGSPGDERAAIVISHRTQGDDLLTKVFSLRSFETCDILSGVEATEIDPGELVVS